MLLLPVPERMSKLIPEKRHVIWLNPNCARKKLFYNSDSVDRCCKEVRIFTIECIRGNQNSDCHSCWKHSAYTRVLMKRKKVLFCLQPGPRNYVPFQILRKKMRLCICVLWCTSAVWCLKYKWNFPHSL